eukprot:4217415-Lingulodinium_polyedra.AAC.1
MGMMEVMPWMMPGTVTTMRIAMRRQWGDYGNDAEYELVNREWSGDDAIFLTVPNVADRESHTI